MQSEGNTFWFKGWLPNGVPGSFTLSINPEYAFEEAMEFTNALLAKGVTLHEPGLEPGQKREAISQIVMGRKTDGTLWADLYSAKAQLENRMVRCYFDADKADVADTFQQVSGYSLNQNHKFWIGDAPVRRGKNIDADAYLITLPRPVNAILYQNPDFVEPPEGQMPKMAKWKVSHFEPMTDTPQPAPAVAASTGNPYATKPTVSVEPAGNEPAWDAAAWTAFMQACKKHNVNGLQLLGVKTIKEWQGGYNAAFAKLPAA